MIWSVWEPGSALVMCLDEETGPWIRAAEEVIVVDNGFENSAAGKPSSPLHKVSIVHCDVKQGFASHGYGAKGSRVCGRNLRC